MCDFFLFPRILYDRVVYRLDSLFKMAFVQFSLVSAFWGHVSSPENVAEEFLTSDASREAFAEQPLAMPGSLAWSTPATWPEQRSSPECGPLWEPGIRSASPYLFHVFSSAQKVFRALAIVIANGKVSRNSSGMTRRFFSIQSLKGNRGKEKCAVHWIPTMLRDTGEGTNAADENWAGARTTGTTSCDPSVFCNLELEESN